MKLLIGLLLGLMIGYAIGGVITYEPPAWYSGSSDGDCLPEFLTAAPGAGR